MSSIFSLLRFKFSDFASLPYEPGKIVHSSTEGSDDHAWKLYLHPATQKTTTPTQYVGLYLKNWEEKSVSVQYAIILRDANGKVYKEQTFVKHLEAFAAVGNKTFVKRSVLLSAESNILVDGALLVDVHIQLKSPAHVP